MFNFQIYGVLKISSRLIKYPNPILRKVSTPVEVFDQDFKILCDDLYNIMLDYDGVGLSAPQIGSLKRVILAMDYYGDIGPKEFIYTMVNPVIVSQQDFITKDEGCLSFPNLFIPIQRYNHITVEYQDSHQKFHLKSFEGLLARVVQHEIDHINGKLFIDYIKEKRNHKSIAKTIRNWEQKNRIKLEE